jgi:hypothetical protein
LATQADELEALANNRAQEIERLKDEQGTLKERHAELEKRLTALQQEREAQQQAGLNEAQKALAQFAEIKQWLQSEANS